MRDGKIVMFDASEAYIENLKKLVDHPKDQGCRLDRDGGRDVGKRRRLVPEIAGRWQDARDRDP